MQFTGERFIPTEQGRIRLEHYHRYAMVLNIVAEKDVLDLACGEGYGSSLIANVARSVTGADISDEAIQHASETYKKSNLKFRQGNATTLDFPDASFDVVVSFETIEHLAEQAKMIAEIRRVLRPDGALVISSPNRPVYSEESGEHNEFHIKELDFNEFDDLLKAQFPYVRYYGQRLLMGSVIQSFNGGQSTYRVWHDDGANLIPQSGTLHDPIYFIAIAGANDSFLPGIDPSIIYPDDLDLVKHYVGFAKWAQDLNATVVEKDKFITNLGHEIQTRDRQIINLSQIITVRDQLTAKRDEQIINLNHSLVERDKQIINLNQSVAKLDAQIISLSQIVTERDQQITNLSHSLIERDKQVISLNQSVAKRDAQIINLNDETVRRGEWALGLEAELNEERERLREEREKLNALLETNSWRLTLPLRETRLWISKPKKQSKRYAKKSLSLAKRLYQALSLDNQKIDNHRNILAKYAPKLLLTTETRLDGTEKVPIPIKSIKEINSPSVLEKHIFFESSASPIKSAKTVEINISKSPLVSVIIPICGKIGYTLNCLASIAANPPQIPFEVIVIDDFSPDNSVEVLTNVKDIRLIKNEQNQGFIRSCNIGANAATGEYLYFLNNDTKVTSGWMDELLRTFYEFPETGLAGSKLIYPDGKLQEAGGIVWQDGSAWNFGRLQDPEMPIYNYAREVDYCSGASIMVPKSIFDELGGFDEYYLPAYFEDADLALKIRDKGYRVIYQPLSTVIHYEGITSGTDINKGTKAYQVENSDKFYLRWKDRLLTHQSPDIDLDKAKDRRAKYRILVLEHCTPTPNQDAGSVIVFNLLLLLREMDFQVTFIPEDNFLYIPEYTTALQRVGVEVLYAPYVTSVEQHLKEYGDRYDLAFLFRPSVVKRNIKTIRKYCSRAKVLYHTVDLHFLRMSREAALFQDTEKAKEADEMKSLEFDAIDASDVGILVSEKELELIQNELPKDKLHVFPLILNTPGTVKRFSDRRDIVFVGGFQHPPNIDAVQYFISEIMPLLRRDLPGVCFYVVGSKPPNEILALASDDIIITGFVEDLNLFLDKMRVSVAPLRYGAGIKGKIGTAMAVGLPVVATNLATEGMSLIDGENIFVADNSESFAKAVVNLYQNEALWNRISQNGLKFAENAWGAELAWKKLSDILTKLGINTIRSERPLSLYSEFNLSRAVKEKESKKLTPIAYVKNRNECELVWENDLIDSIRKAEKTLLELSNREIFEVDGFCVPCNKEVSFLVDMKFGGQRQGNNWLPNWRERLECPLCKMNNRQRLITTLVEQILYDHQNKHVYFTEQVTPIFKWVSETFNQHKIVGSEYFGAEYDGGTIINGTRHEDVENLSFFDNEFDLIVSNDVFEHVPNPAKAFAECARVLKQGGIMLATIPFHIDKNNSVVRAMINDDKLEYLLPPVYHGNPISDDGSLVFSDFGWDILDYIKQAGFSDVVIGVYASEKLGHLGDGQLVFEAKR